MPPTVRSSRSSSTRSSRGPRIHRRLRPVAATCAAALLLVACGTEPLAPFRDEDQPDGTAGGDEAPLLDPDTQPAPSDGDDGPADAEAPRHAEAPEVPPPYEPHANEIRPNAKTLASRVVERLTNYDVDADLDVVALEAAHGGRAEGLRADAEELLHRHAWSRGEVVYPQLGGMEDDSTAVMVVVRQMVGRDDGTVQQQTRTLDVRLTLRQGSWAFAELASAGGPPAPRPDGLPKAAAAVLDDERIDLPDSARWDIHRGGIDEELLRLMSRLAERTPYGVVVLDSGHPWEVYGTDRQSKHSMGKAVDIHRLAPDGPLVIESRGADSPVLETVEWVYEQPLLSEVGSPWALDGYGGRSFSDPLHQDHLHVAVGDRDDAAEAEEAEEDG